MLHVHDANTAANVLADLPVTCEFFVACHPHVPHNRHAIGDEPIADPSTLGACKDCATGADANGALHRRTGRK